MVVLGIECLNTNELEKHMAMHGEYIKAYWRLSLGDFETEIIKDMYFYGYLDKDLPSQFRPFSLTAPQQADFVHNILLWDGDVVDENRNPVDVQWDSSKSYVLVLDTEAVSPKSELNIKGI